jgi:hypothetical protein
MRYETERTGRRGHPDSGTDARARGRSPAGSAWKAAKT